MSTADNAARTARRRAASSRRDGDQDDALGVADDDHRRRRRPIQRARSERTQCRRVGFDFFKVFDVPLLAGRVFDREHAEDMPRRAAGPVRGRQDCRRRSCWSGSGGGAPANGPAPAAPPTNIVVDRSFVAGWASDARGGDRQARLPARAADGPGAIPQPPLRIIGVVEDRSFSFFKTPSRPSARSMRWRTVSRSPSHASRRPTSTAGSRAIDATWKQLAPERRDQPAFPRRHLRARVLALRPHQAAVRLPRGDGVRDLRRGPLRHGDVRRGPPPARDRRAQDARRQHAADGRLCCSRASRSPCWSRT